MKYSEAYDLVVKMQADVEVLFAGEEDTLDQDQQVEIRIKEVSTAASESPYVVHFTLPMQFTDYESWTMVRDWIKRFIG
jgi:hypothetical protein